MPSLYEFIGPSSYPASFEQTLLLVPTSGSVLGGDTALIGGSVPLTSSLSFESESLPSGWTSGLSGSGVVTLGSRGTLLATGPTANSVAAVQTTGADFEHFDVRLDAEITRPGATLASCDMLALRFATPSSTLDVGFRRDGTTDRVYCEITTPALTSTLETYIELDDNENEEFSDYPLRLVRNGSRVWAFWGDRLIGSTVHFETGAGRLFIRAANQTSGSSVIAKTHTLDILHAARIDETLLDALSVAGDRVVGKIPAAPLRETSGTRDVVIFGPGGERTLSDYFSYYKALAADRQEASIYMK